LLLLIASATLAAHAWWYRAFLSDDGIISLQYARRFLTGHGLTWTDGPSVEGYSNFLWVMVVAGLGAPGVDLIVAVRLLGYLGMLASVAWVVWWHDPDRDTTLSWYPPLAAVAFFCLAGPVAAWTMGGLEQPLVAALLAMALALALRAVELPVLERRSVIVLSVPLALLCLTRPDGVVFTATVGGGILLGRTLTGRPCSWRTLAWIGVLPAAAVLGQLGFRVLYYDDWIPNTARVKLTPSAHHRHLGYRYIYDGLRDLGPFSHLALVALAAGLVSRRNRAMAVVLVVTLVPWLAYVWWVGGDIFPASRHLIPAIVVLAFATVMGGRALVRLTGGRRWAQRAIVAALLLLSGWYVHDQFDLGDNKAARSQDWVWDGQVVGTLLHDAFADRDPLLAITAAGCLPYWSQLRCLDMLGLNDRHIARVRRPDRGSGKLGHECVDANYVLSQEPDIIAWHVGRVEPELLAEQVLDEHPVFREGFLPLYLNGRRPRSFTSALWFRRDSPRVGIARSADRIDLPAHFLADTPERAAHLDADGQLVVTMESRSQVAVAIPDAGAGDWDLDLAASPPNVLTWQVTSVGDTVTVRLTNPQDRPVQIEALVLRPAAGDSTSTLR
jgi:hypothetical protein